LEKYKDAVDLLGESRGCKPCVTEHSIEDFYQNAKDYGIDISNEGDIVGVKLEFHFGPKDSKIIILNYNKCIGLQYDARGLLIEKWLIEHGFIEQ